MVFNGILKLMPGASRTVNKKHLTFNIRTIVKGQLSKVKGKSKGFTLIELLVVITLFAIVSTLITASYTTFERNQRIKHAAQTLKNDLRLVQNKALAGDKGVSNVPAGDCTDLNKCCPNIYLNNNYSLVGWYVTFNTAQTSTYTYAGVCKNNTGGTETSFNSKTISYPSGVTLHSIDIGGNGYTGIVKALFKPVSTGVSLHSTSAPPFLDATGNLTNIASQAGNLVVRLKDQQSASAKYEITVRTSGEVSDVIL